MIQVKPKTFFIASTALYNRGVREWLDYVGGGAVLENIAGGDAERLIELAARRCYKSFDVGLNLNVTKIRKNSAEYHENILSSAHGSVLAHATATWAFEDVSRVFTHELCRNVIGIKDNDTGDDVTQAEFGLSQESLRYVRLDQLRVWLPPEFQDDEFLRGEIISGIEYLETMQRKLARHMQIDTMPFAQKKKVTSALRRLLPMGIGTGIVWTANFRTLRWLIELRTSQAAEIEFRLAFDPVAQTCVDNWPMVFGDFVRTDTGDGAGEWKPKYRKV